jgi:hypothetical protein
MATVAAKFWFAVAALAAVGFVAYELASSGEWFGSLLLASVVIVSGGLGVLATAVRDGVVPAEESAPIVARSALPTGWPALGAAGAGTAIVGLAGRNQLLYVGIGVLGFVFVEWLVSAWAERSTSDREYNRGLRHRIMSPLEIPLLAAAVIGIFLAAASRVLLALPKDGSVVFAGALAVVILAGASILAAKPKLGSSVIVGILALGAVGLIAGGIASGIAGERHVEKHHDETSKTETPAASESNSTTASTTP